MRARQLDRTRGTIICRQLDCAVVIVKEMRLTVLCATLSVLLLGSVAVDKNNFKTCGQSSFCK